jgi:hypothetical protein
MSVTKTKAAQREHLLLVMNDPDYHKDMEAGLKSDELRKLYGHSPEDVRLTMEQYKLYKDGFYPLIGGWVKQDESTGEFTALLNADIKKHQFDELWGYMQRISKMNNLLKPSKEKLPEDMELLYAIFKSRARGHTFPQIFKMYRSGSLPSYENKPTNKFETEFEMKKYYSKYYNPL